MGQTSDSQAFLFLPWVSKHYPNARLSPPFPRFLPPHTCMFFSPSFTPHFLWLERSAKREERVIMLGMSAEDGL